MNTNTSNQLRDLLPRLREFLNEPNLGSPNRREFDEIMDELESLAGPVKDELYQASFDRDRDGSLYDRGGADSWYSRGTQPHWYPNGSYNEPRIESLDAAQVAEYMAGYNDNEKSGGKKEW